MTRSPNRFRRLCPTSLSAHGRDQSGFTVIEALGAIVLFVIVATAMAGLLVSAIKSNGTARQRTIAQQEVQAQIEVVRRMAYDKVGVVSGNPPGTLQATTTVTRSGLQLRVNIAVKYVADKAPTSYATGANYKQVTITILRARDGKQLAKDVTYVANPARAPLGGLNNAIINVQVVDYALVTPIGNATVALASTSPSANLSDTTDGTTGSVTFPALTPNTSSSYYYDVTASLSGFVTLKDDLPPAAAAHHSLAPSETFNTTIRMYKPATIDVVLHNADGSAYTGDATVTVSSTRGSQNFNYTGSALTITDVNGEKVVPSLQYTVSASTTGGLVATPVTKYVPDDYPSVLTTTFTLTFPAPSALVVTVTQGGVGVSGATVQVTDGTINVTGTTDGSFAATFSAINPGTYTITATSAGQSASTTATTVANQTTYITIDVPVPPGTVLATVTWGGTAVNGATVTLTGGPSSINLSGTSNASGQVTFSNIPPGTGYTVTATKTGQSGQVTGVTVISAQTTNVTLTLPTGAITATLVWNGSPVSGATLTLTGGPQSVNVSGVTNGSGQYTFANVPAGSGYTITAPSGSNTANVTAGSTTNVTITVPTGTLNVNVKRSGVNVSGATVVLVGGPLNITMTLTTDVNGNVSFTNVPTGSNYTIKAYKCTVSNPKSKQVTSITVNTGANSQNLSFSTNTCPLP